MVLRLRRQVSERCSRTFWESVLKVRAVYVCVCVCVCVCVTYSHSICDVFSLCPYPSHHTPVVICAMSRTSFLISALMYKLALLSDEEYLFRAQFIAEKRRHSIKSATSRLSRP